MAINRLQAALAAVTNEVTVAAAQINFDFTLIKHEAPREYQLLGKNLSQKRKDDAESGSIHITARRLGALFDRVCAPTPNLLKAYGTRVSETSDELTSTASSEAANSIFAAYSGFDGTSIWAAATSSMPAIQVQLLACLLSRLLDAPEAISVWVEIVKERRKEIAGQYEAGEEIHYATMTAAAQSEISRSQLAEWDASARSWLRTADKVKSRQQKKLLLVLDNLNLPVNEDVRVYSSVMSTWKTSLETMENLIRGIPQAVENGAALLGLAAWHIYPDMVVVGSDKPDMRMQDTLVAPGGVLTVGIKRPRKTDGEESQGIYWSLSLAHLRYYGSPVLTERQLSSDTSRLTFSQFTQTVFGSLLGCWSVQGSDVTVACRFFSAVAETLRREVTRDPDNITLSEMLKPAYWLSQITAAALSYSTVSEAEERNTLWKLIRLGQRRASIFLQNPTQKSEESDYGLYANSWPPFFDLREPDVFYPSLKNEEAQIAFLRRIAARIDPVLAKHLVIRFRSRGTLWHFATAVATPSPHIHPSNPFYAEAGQHQRWYQPEAKIKAEVDVRHDAIVERWRQQDQERQKRPSALPRALQIIAKDHFRKDREVLPQHPGETSEWQEKDHFVNESLVCVLTRPSFGDNESVYRFISGDADTAALFISQDHEEQAKCLFDEQINLEDLIWCLQADMFSLNVNRSSLVTALVQGSPPALDTMTAVGKIYEGLPGATVDIRVLNKPVANSKWASSWASKTALVYDSALRAAQNEGLQSRGAGTYAGPKVQAWMQSLDLIDHEIALSCIAYFESGGNDIGTDQTKDSFALSSGDSMYISEKLFRDPWDKVEPYKFKHILGNVGRTGITMLIPPQSPMVKKLEPGAWNVINNVAFNGVAENHFDRTSLHLAFTEYYRPIDLFVRGEQDSRAALLESVVSVHDSGQWVADLDILDVLTSQSWIVYSDALFGRGGVSRVARMDSPKPCTCGTATKIMDGREFISIECWDEIVDLPFADSVVRARGSATARLAVTTVLVQLMKRERKDFCILISPPEGDLCLTCNISGAGRRKTVVVY
ncbi:hypothetical protein E2P81_ATG06283 [Venturia nashicola]|nr:hypothetical protein E2P81_ATG06283 [Venturia nashicola]